MVNPRAGYEVEYPLTKSATRKTIIVVGLGVAGLSCAYYAAMRGHHVIAYDEKNLGGQFNLASEIPGKEVYRETIRYFDAQLSLSGVEVHRNFKVGFEDLRDVYADAIVFATGVTPRKPEIEGIDHFSVMDYETAIKNKTTIKDKVAIIGAGGIGFDVAEMLVHDHAADDAEGWYRQWGIDKQYANRGGVLNEEAGLKARREVYLLQRKDEKPGSKLARSTGWIRRLTLRKAGVKMMTGVHYEKIDDFGLHIEHDGKKQVLAVDHVIICAGQESENSLFKQLNMIGQPVHIIGGASKAAELDAETAIREGMMLAYSF
jgi:2,4-dienoyl-CoA reductase (NADPH2)